MKNSFSGSTNVPKRLCIVLTVDRTFGFYNTLIPYLIENGWEVTALSGVDQGSNIDVTQWGATFVPMPFVRAPSPLIDLWCLLRLWWFFLWNRFDVVQVASPKACLLGTLAASLTRQKVVLSFIGRAYENYSGWKRRLFVQLDRISCRLAHCITAESESLKNAILADGCCREGKILAGTMFDIDEHSFDYQHITSNEVRVFKNENGICNDDLVFLFVGRLSQEKGIVELVHSFNRLQQNDAHLVLVGDRDERAGVISADFWDVVESRQNIHELGHMTDPRVAYAACDIFICPTHRESLSVVTLEASLMRKPVITTDAIGAIDSVVDGVTGILIPKMSEGPLFQAMQILGDDASLRDKMGDEGRRWVVQQFGNRAPTIWAEKLFERCVFLG